MDHKEFSIGGATITYDISSGKVVGVSFNSQSELTLRSIIGQCCDGSYWVSIVVDDPRVTQECTWPSWNLES